MNLKHILEYSVVDNYIDPSEYIKYDVKKGLRNEDHTGVLVGLTKISDVRGYICQNNHKIENHGKLYYRGYEVKNLINYLHIKDHKGFEETIYLLLFGQLPNNKEYQIFKDELTKNMNLPDELITHIIQTPYQDMMNKIQSTILLLYGYDKFANDTSVYNTLKQGLALIAKMPYIIAYSYYYKNINEHKRSLIYGLKEETMTQSLLRLIRADGKYSQIEAEILDLMLILHADHGGGNNSTFTNVVVASTGTDLYSSMSASVGSLKGPRHGGASLAVVEMMEAVIKEIGYSENEDEIKKIIKRILNKDFYDHKGLVYGIGHAVYTLSDPRSILLQEKARELSHEKGFDQEFAFYQRFEKYACELLLKEKGKQVSSNIDFYSGLIYKMLNIPKCLVAPLFVCARMAGWLAHNIENKCYCDKIIRPATKYIKEEVYEKSNDV